MPRKQNGFGNPKSLGFNKPRDISKGKTFAPGSYPRERRYGSSVTRTIIEKYNLDSTWVRWRKGMEYAYKSAWYRLMDYDPITQTYSDSQIKSKLYQGTRFEYEVIFEGYKFATKNADSNNHYVIKRIPLDVGIDSTDIGTIGEIKNDPVLYPELQARGEVHATLKPGRDADILFQMIGDRLTDGETTATLDFILTDKGRPALFIGKSLPPNRTTAVPDSQTVVSARMDASGVLNSQWYADNGGNLQALIGKVVYVPQLFVERDIGDISNFDALEEVQSRDLLDAREYFAVRIADAGDSEVQILDTNTELPPSLYDISTLDPIAIDANGSFRLNGIYIYKKSLYQRFYGQQYLTGQLALEDVEALSYSVMPFVINAVTLEGNELVLQSAPFTSELKLYAQSDKSATLIFRDQSFTKFELDEYDGEYYHQSGAPTDPLWRRLDIDVDPWMDEVFANGTPLKPAITYTCSCPNFAKAMLSAPQQTQGEDERRNNRQRRYPLPTVMGRNDFDQLGTVQAAGKIESWETRDDRMKFKCCKHTIAAMFIEKLKVKEPNSYPTVDAREAFEAKLDEDIQQVPEKFIASYERGGLTTLEVVFALAQGLNLDDVETAYVVLNSSF